MTQPTSPEDSNRQPDTGWTHLASPGGQFHRTTGSGWRAEIHLMMTVYANWRNDGPKTRTWRTRMFDPQGNPVHTEDLTAPISQAKRRDDQLLRTVPNQAWREKQE